MTDDLVKRLRDPFYTPSLKSHAKAADRIEKLEAALRRIADVTEKWEHDLISQVNEISRKALNAK